MGAAAAARAFALVGSEFAQHARASARPGRVPAAHPRERITPIHPELDP